MKNEIFISYSWANKDIADKIYSDLTLIGLSVLKDNHHLNYTDSISDFMLKIRDSRYAILIISDSYLKSVNCMFEVLQLLKDDKVVWDKILPINVDAKYYNITDRLIYVKYWQEKEKTINEAIKELDPSNALSTLQELKNIRDIVQNIDSFLVKLKDCLSLNPKEFFLNSYQKLFNRIEIEPDTRKLIELIPIDAIANPHKKLKKINQFIKTNNFENSVCYNIVGDCYKDLKQKESAIAQYKKAIELNQLNFSAWNNLGQVYEYLYLNYDEAKIAYEKSIEANPTDAIPRLNLAVLYKNHFKDISKSIELNESILKFDENNASAHSNLANMYRFIDPEKFEKHIIISVNQDHFNSILLYANYLKFEKRNFELGNQFYLKARELDKKGVYKSMIDVMLSSTKG